MAKQQGTTYELRIQLNDIEPPIWRTFTVPDDIALNELHVIVQVVMGWTNSHLHEFRQGKLRFAPADHEVDEMGEPADKESETLLNSLLLRQKQQLIYEYDFGDGWTHSITLLRMLPAPCTCPRVVAGERACPPEDCGGPYSFMERLTAIKNPVSKDDHELVEWWKSMTPDGYDSEVYPIEEVNAILAKGIDAVVEEFEDTADGW